MTKGRKFSWKNIRDDQLGSNQHDDHEESLSENANLAIRIENRGMESQSLMKNEIYNNRLLANDELYIAPHDDPGLALTSDLFDGRNFHSWCRTIKRALFARNKLGFLNGEVVEPRIDSVDHKQWVKADCLVFNWLINSIVKELSRGLQKFDTSKQLWDELHKRFGERDGPRIYKLRREIATYTQNSQSVMLYFHNMSSLWDELGLLKAARSCTCEAAEDAKSELEEERMMQFLRGLNDVYEPIRQQILILDPLPSVSQAYSKVLQVEELLQISSQFSENLEQSALLTNQNRNFSKDGFRKKLTREEKMKMKCDHCGRSGHLKRDCFEIIGTPDWYKKMKEEKGSKRANFVADRGTIAERGTTAEPGFRQASTDLEKTIQAEIAKHFATYMERRPLPEKNGGKLFINNLSGRIPQEIGRLKSY